MDVHLEFLLKNGYTVRTLATAMNKSIQTIYNWKKGIVKVPHKKNLALLDNLFYLRLKEIEMESNVEREEQKEEAEEAKVLGWGIQ